MSAAPRVRPLALAVIRRGDAILVGESRNGVKRETFYRQDSSALNPWRTR